MFHGDSNLFILFLRVLSITASILNATLKYSIFRIFIMINQSNFNKTRCTGCNVSNIGETCQHREILRAYIKGLELPYMLKP